MKESNAPYVTLGQHLKYVREQSGQTRFEVSGAVEIDERSLERIEAGLERPAEDILLLLINYFGVKDQEALQIWESAEYDGDIPDQLRPEALEEPDDEPHTHTHTSTRTMTTVVMMVNADNRAVYSDGLEVIWNQSGMTLNFMQATAPGQHLAVARVGMSFAQAEQVADILQRALLRAKYSSPTKLLPSAKTAKTDTPSKSPNTHKKTKS